MAITKSLYETILQIEVEDGVDASGNTAYKKKNFSKIKGDATDQKVYDVAEAIKTVLQANAVGYFLEQNYIMTEESAPQS